MVQVGEEELPVQEFVLLAFLVLSLIFNIFLFRRGHGSYTIKYQLMMKETNFWRVNQKMCSLIDFIYKCFFALPFVLLIAIGLIRAIKKPIDFLPIIVNGLILILILYPAKKMFYYIRQIIIWVLAIASQFITLFLYEFNSGEKLYTELSTIFYVINCILFSLAMLSHEKGYWEIDEAVRACEDDVRNIKSHWLQTEERNLDSDIQIPFESQIKKPSKRVVYKNIPSIFNGGIFGALCRNYSLKKFLILYSLSLVMLGVYAFLVWLKGSSLGIIGMITNIIFDLFIFTFNTLQTEERTISNVFVLVFFGRLLSFIFGQTLWLFGYCILYFFIGIFIGKIIINEHFPMKAKRESQTNKRKNCLKTPQFVLFILTAEILLLVLAANFGVSSQKEVSYSTYTIPLWQFALIVVIITWIAIIYLASLRMVERFENNIRDKVEYYFGIQRIHEYHIYVLVTYLFVILLGVYSFYVLRENIIFLSCIFLPILYIMLGKVFVQWGNNQYQVLVQIDQYNAKTKKKLKILEKKLSAYQMKKSKENPQNSQVRLLENDSRQRISQLQIKIQPVQSHIVQETKLVLNFRKQSQNQSQRSSQTNQSQSGQKKQYQRNEYMKQYKDVQSLIKPINWRTYEGNIQCCQMWQYFTRSDKWLVILMPMTVLALIIYIVVSFLISQSFFGAFVGICFVAYVPLVSYYKSVKTLQDLVTAEVVVAFVAFAIGIVFWIVFNQHFALAVAWAAIYALICVGFLIYGVTKNMQSLTKRYLIVKIFCQVAFICIFLGMFAQSLIAITVSIVLFLMCVGAVPLYLLYTTGDVPKPVKIVTGIIVISGILAVAIIGFILDVVSDFAVFSFLMGFLFLTLFFVASVIYYQKQINSYNTPHVYSAYGVPIYKFQSATEKLKTSKNHQVIYNFASIVLIVYSFVISIVFVDQRTFAIYTLGLYSVIGFFHLVLPSIKTYYEIGLDRNKLTKELYSSALNDLANKYMMDLDDLRSSQSLERQKYRKKQQAEKIDTSDQSKLNEAWHQVAKLNYEYVNNLEEEEKFLFFWLALIQFNLFALKRSEMIKLVNQVKQIQTELIQYGIYIESSNFVLSIEHKHTLISKQIESLNPYDYINFENVLKRHQESTKKMVQAQKQEGKKQQVLNQIKQKEMYNKLKESSQGKGNRIRQFNDLVKNLGKGQYTDEQFPPNDTVLGDMSSLVSQWRRPKMAQCLVKGSFSAEDVKQGQIGDCYLISSFGVLGQKWIRQAFGYNKNQSQGSLWVNSKGAYMIKFYKFLKEIYIIIDDFLPINDQDQFIFAKSEEPLEFWPSILQKAYAKLYSGYDNIVEGKCHRVFAEFTGGFPFQILVESYQKNHQGLWTKVITSLKNRYLLAAGSPSNPLGDTVASKRGIVQGHAYSILGAKQVEQYKLIKLKNPHGSGGAEWNGDFSDSSQYMSNRMMQLLEHQQKDDGIFWMKLEDFIHEYKSLYICAVFDQQWLKIDPIQGEFTDQNSFGTPNLSIETFKNPQFGITASQKCTLFVNLTQQAQNALQGKNFIYMRIQRNEGKRISKQNLSSQKLCGAPMRPTNAVSLSTEIELQADSFPCTFTLYISCKDAGDTGKYTLEMYSDNKDVQIVGDQEFDRSQF